MTLANIFKSSVLGVALLCTLSDSAGMSLGRPRSVALLGQPLELTVPVQFDAEEKASALCFEADVYFGENKLDSSQVAVTVPAVEQDAVVNVRVVSRQAIDEPVVTVYLRGGCLHKSTRKFVLLADLATDMVVPSLPISIQVRPLVSGSVSPLASPSVAQREMLSAPSRGDNLPVKRTRPVTPVVSAPALESADGSPKTKPSVGVSSSVVNRSRLKLAPIDLTIERDPVLKLTAAMAYLPSEDLNKRNEAVALWQALNASPQDVLRDQTRVRSLEDDLKLQRDATSKNAQTLQNLTTRLEHAEAQKYANPLVYALAGLLVVCCVGLAFTWNRLRTQAVGISPWWRAENNRLDEAEDLPSSGKDLVARDEAPPLSFSTDDSASSAPVAAQVDIDLDLGESVFAKFGGVSSSLKGGSAVTDVQPLDVSVSMQRDFSSSALDGLRSMNMQEMLDVRQQAEFFMTLGQYDEAIGLLTTSIMDSGESNPLVYLELLKALHSLSRKADYDDYRADFNARFTGHVPEYTGFNQGGQDLEAYPNVLSRIVVTWPSKQTLEVIEECLVRRHGVVPEHEFDLDAYRDLLILHGVASRILSTSDSGPAPFSTAKIELPQAPAPIEDLMSVDFVTEQFDSPESATPEVSSVPLPEILDDHANYSVDLDLSDGASNLMDFDVEHLSESAPLANAKPEAGSRD